MVTQSYQCIRTKTNTWARSSNMSLQMPIFAVSYHISSMSLSCMVQEIWSHKITNAYRAMKHGLLQGLTAPIMMGLSLCLIVFINLNLSCIQWYKFRVCRGKSSRDTVTQIYSCDQNHEKWFISRAHSSISNGMSHYVYIPL